jgi:transposase
MVSQLHQRLLELIPSGAKKGPVGPPGAKTLLAKVRPRDAAGKTRRRVAELIAETTYFTRLRRRLVADRVCRRVLAVQAPMQLRACNSR